MYFCRFSNWIYSSPESIGVRVRLLKNGGYSLCIFSWISIWVFLSQNIFFYIFRPYVDPCPKPRSFPPLIFHHLIDNHRHQFTPRPTQAQEDKDYEVKNCHPRTSPAGISNILNNEISNLTILELVGQNLQAIPNLITFPHLKAKLKKMAEIFKTFYLNFQYFLFLLVITQFGKLSKFSDRQVLWG